MVLFEVAQVSMRNWTPTKAHEGAREWLGIYLEVTVAPVASKGCAFCRRRRHVVTRRARTTTVDESKEMRWRTVNEEGFLVALFALETPRVARGPVAKKSEDLVLLADVFRTEIGSESAGAKLCTVSCQWKVGTWGSVELSLPEGRNGAAEFHGTQVVLELRPPTTRPFSLERARPIDQRRTLETEYARCCTPSASLWRGLQRPLRRSPLGAAPWRGIAASLEAAVRTSPLSPKGRKSPIAYGGRRLDRSIDSPNGNGNRRVGLSSLQAPDSHGPDSPSGSRRGNLTGQNSPMPCCLTGPDSPSGSRRLALAGPDSPGATRRVTLALDGPDSPSGTKRVTLAGLDSPGTSSRRLDRTIMGLGSASLSDEIRSPDSPWRSKASASAAVSSWKNYLFSGTRSLASDAQERMFQEWVPCEWQRIWWGNNTPGQIQCETEDVRGVEAQMENEFRRDCIVFFNTLFPRSQGRGFMIMRRLAFSNTSMYKPFPDAKGCTVEARGAIDSKSLLSQATVEFGPATSTGTNCLDSPRDLAAEFARNPRALSNISVKLPQQRSGKTVWERLRDYFTICRRRKYKLDVLPSDLSQISIVDVDGGTPCSRNLPVVSETDKTLRVSDTHSDISDTDSGGRRTNGAATAENSAKSVSFKCAKNRPRGLLPTDSDSLVDALSSPNSDGRSIHIADREDDECEKVVKEAQAHTVTFGPRDEHSVVVSNGPPNVPIVAEKGAVTPPPGLPLLFARNGALGEVLSTAVHGPTCCQLPGPGRVLVDEYSPRIMLLKRLMICFAQCGVYYSEVPNSTQLGELWPYPLAAVLGHGSRILIRLEDIEGSEFVNFLLSGNPRSVDWKESGVPRPLRRRIAASHTVEHAVSGHLAERRLRVNCATDAAQNLADGMIRKKHFGLNLPIGGVGNPSALGQDTIIGFRGEVFQKRPRFSSKSRFTVNFGQRPSKDVQLTSLTSGNTKELPYAPSFGPNWTEATSATTASTPDASDKVTNSTTDKMTISTTEPTFTPEDTAPTLAEIDWQVTPNQQNGHLYLRVDDFGEQTTFSGASGASPLACPNNTASEDPRRSLLQFRPKKDMLPISMAKLRTKYEEQHVSAGELLFPSHVMRLRNTTDSLLTFEGMSEGLKLLRVRSAPDLLPRAMDASKEDMTWVNQAILWDSPSPLHPPPSEAALRMLLEHYDPLNVQLFGTARFKSIAEFRKELTMRSSLLIKASGGIQRYCEPVILQLSWRGHVLMKAAERNDEKDCKVHKNTFIVTRMMENEEWQAAIRRVVANELAIDPESLRDLLPNDVLGRSDNNDPYSHKIEEQYHDILYETTISPSYPGLLTSYKSHMVRWEILPDGTGPYGMIGLPSDPQLQLTEAPRSFETMKMTEDGRQRKLYWRWVPSAEAQRLQRFLNMGESTRDERWAKYAFQKEGVVKFPPSANALDILLNRCGVDTHKFGADNLHDFWMELTNQESFLQMCRGQPLRVADAIFVKLRWRPPPAEGEDKTRHFKVLCKVIEDNLESEEVLDGPTKKLLHTRLRVEDHEMWEGAALRCIGETLGLTAQQVKSLVTRDRGSYTFFEERKKWERYPDLDCLYRTHLVIFTLRDDAPVSQYARALALPKVPIAEDLESGAPGVSSSRFLRSGMLSPVMLSPSSFKSPASLFGRLAASPVRPFNLEWVDECALIGVRGAELWDEARRLREKHHVSSVLIGLEGTAPNSKSPFGFEHDALAGSATISATGNSKWRTFKRRNALQVPADIGGLRMRITRRMLDDLIKTCDLFDLCDPSFDLVTDPWRSHPRHVLDQRFAEKELFKQILSGNCQEAQRAVAWMKEYRTLYKTPEKVYRDVSAGRNHPRDNSVRTLPGQMMHI